MNLLLIKVLCFVWRNIFSLKKVMPLFYHIFGDLFCFRRIGSLSAPVSEKVFSDGRNAMCYTVTRHKVPQTSWRLFQQQKICYNEIRWCRKVQKRDQTPVQGVFSCERTQSPSPPVPEDALREGELSGGAGWKQVYWLHLRDRAGNLRLSILSCHYAKRAGKGLWQPYPAGAQKDVSWENADAEHRKPGRGGSDKPGGEDQGTEQNVTRAN